VKNNILFPKVFFVSVFILALFAAPQVSNAENGCAASLSSNFTLSVPIVTYAGQAYWADFQYVPNTMDFALTNVGPIADASEFSTCAPATLSPSLELQIPTVIFNGVSYWADFQYDQGVNVTLTRVGPRTSYSLADLVGTWEMNELVSPGPEWMRGTFTIGSDGSLSGTQSASDGSTYTLSSGDTASITTDGIITPMGSDMPSSDSCVMDSGKSMIVCTWTGFDGISTGMTILTKKAATYSLADLAATWGSNELLSPGPWWGRSTGTINSDGSFTGSLSAASDGETGTLSGTFSMTTDGIMTMSGAGINGVPTCAMDSGKRIMACTHTGNCTGTLGSCDGMIIFSKQAASYSMADLAGTWEMNELNGPGPEWMRGTVTIGSDGLLSGTLNVSDGTTQTLRDSSLSITAYGNITATGTNANQSLGCVMDSLKSIMVCTATSSGGDAQMIIFSKS
jgi:hypothetical protein